MRIKKANAWDWRKEKKKIRRHANTTFHLQHIRVLHCWTHFLHINSQQTSSSLTSTSTHLLPEIQQQLCVQTLVWPYSLKFNVLSCFYWNFCEVNMSQRRLLFNILKTVLQGFKSKLKSFFLNRRDYSVTLPASIFSWVQSPMKPRIVVFMTSERTNCGCHVGAFLPQ